MDIRDHRDTMFHQDLLTVISAGSELWEQLHPAIVLRTTAEQNLLDEWALLEGHHAGEQCGRAPNAWWQAAHLV